MSSKPRKTWTVAEAKARLSENLRLASEEGPLRIGTGPRDVIVTLRPFRRWAPGRLKGSLRTLAPFTVAPRFGAAIRPCGQEGGPNETGAAKNQALHFSRSAHSTPVPDKRQFFKSTILTVKIKGVGSNTW